MEINPCEAVANNVTGTRNLVELSGASAVDRFVQISTDKAVHPTSIMGASKRVCEMIVQSQKNCQGTLFCCVRFGNVLGSRGSIVPIFQQQILRGGPVTVTHPEAKRFLMTIPEAVCLLIQAGTLAHAGDIFVLDMGEPVLIKKLAKDLIELSGFSSSHDVRIEISGIKPGEKLSEVLVDNARERLRPTRLPKIQTITAVPFDLNHFSRGLRTLERSAWQGDAAEVYRNLAALNIGFIHDGSQRTWSSSTRRPAVATSSASVAAPHGK
jgi:FlaA1/EpsC-like NDP-sugar epimerase